MPKSKKIIHCLDMGIFPGFLSFSCGFSYDEIISYFKKTKAELWLLALEKDRERFQDANYLALKREITRTVKGKEECKVFYFIHIRDRFTFTDYEFCKLAHEVVHICQFHLPAILNRDREIEAEAYLHTHIMMQCLKALR